MKNIFYLTTLSMLFGLNIIAMEKSEWILRPVHAFTMATTLLRVCDPYRVDIKDEIKEIKEYPHQSKQQYRTKRNHQPHVNKSRQRIQQPK